MEHKQIEKYNKQNVC